MTANDAHRIVQVRDGEGTVLSAEVFAQDEVDASTGDTVRTAHAVLERPAGHVAPGVRGTLVDAIAETAEVHDSARLVASIPLGDSETLFRFAEVFTDVTLHAAGSTALLESVLDDSRTESEPATDRD